MKNRTVNCLRVSIYHFKYRPIAAAAIVEAEGGVNTFTPNQLLRSRNLAQIGEVVLCKAKYPPSLLSISHSTRVQIQS